ncbi:MULTISPECIES: hypothetical protein [Pseudonocardia]|uniref:Uncharacterized protein n=2 Tax=Pseudonocardia TaxID=1847 RepID=A0A1Y2MUR3_PSEAH|nr:MULTISPECIES: hypothetical protein [Pseudonocardia]OSY38922.1 hypothetical protein BG845_03794 [Pseudonocardia autotrophica]TDN76178.1 hypothetical protein C8E95_5371 [Pseudonocardia autotrophica]BBG00159.1 hypothetical protein Pdca_13680 [Pseudonocardia autotrophica]GEC26772.1 hypothetical protein PSA01_38010 [Pseudonocardia saturnea]
MVAGIALDGPVPLRHLGTVRAVTVGVAIVLLTVLPGWRLRRRGGRVAAVAAGMLALAPWLGLCWLGSLITPERVPLAEVHGPPGSALRLTVLDVRTWAGDGHTSSIRLHAGDGPFARETPVWTVGGPPPRDVRFVATQDPVVVGVTDAAGCGQRITVTGLRPAVSADPPVC